jgi:hypothetical protein
LPCFFPWALLHPLTALFPLNIQQHQPENKSQMIALLKQGKEAKEEARKLRQRLWRDLIPG